MDLLRFATAGSVDDGKSTLIGRLLYDSQSVPDDQLEAIEAYTQRRGEDQINLALLTDGLRAEREQGITIDVAYRYFSTTSRKFILSDSPGHKQYTRNMVTAISGTDLVVLIADARHGLLEQTRRHIALSHIFGIKHLVVCLNKMDLVNWSELVFNDFKAGFQAFIKETQFETLHFFPVSALLGDNVVHPSENMPWYRGLPLLDFLNTIQVQTKESFGPGRFPIQMVIRPNLSTVPNFRACAGNMAGGNFNKGQEVLLLPSGQKTKIEAIYSGPEEIEMAQNGKAISLVLADDLDAGRGDMLVEPSSLPIVGNEFEAMLCWLQTDNLTLGKKYGIKHNTREAKCVIKQFNSRLNIETLENETLEGPVLLNHLVKVIIKTSVPLVADLYTENRNTGSFIIIDEQSGNTLAGGIVLGGA